MKNPREGETRRQTARRAAILGIVAFVFIMYIAGFIGAMKYNEYKSEAESQESREITPEEMEQNSGFGFRDFGTTNVTAASWEDGSLVRFIPYPETNPFTGRPVVDYSKKGEALYVPEGIGSVHSYMTWQSITDPTTKQFQLLMEAEAYDENDFGVINGKYVVAVKPYYGKIGDYLDVIQDDDSVLHCIIGDYKGNENEITDGENSKYYHHDKSVVEFIVNGYAWFDTERTVYDYHPEWHQNIKAIYNVGNYWGE